MFNLTKFHFADVLLFLAVVAGQNAVGYMEVGRHRLVVRDALGIVALHDALDLVRRLYGFLLHHLVVADDVQDDLRRHHGETRDLIVGEELVGYLDDTLVAHLLRGVVETDGDGSLQVKEPEQAGHLVGLLCRDVVDDGAVLNGGYQAFFLVHRIMVLSFLTSSRLMPSTSQKMASRAKSPLPACWM